MKYATYIILIATLLINHECIASNTASNTTVKINTEQWPPANFINDKNQIDGTNTKIIKDIFSIAHINYKISIYPWARAIAQTRQNPNTFIYSIARTPQRENQYIWIAKLMDTRYWFYASNANSIAAPKTLSDIKSHFVVCVENKDVAEDELEKIGFSRNKNILIANSYRDCTQFVRLNPTILLVDIQPDQSVSAKDFKPLFPLNNAQSIDLYLAANLASSPALVNKLRAATRALSKHRTIMPNPGRRNERD